MDDLTSRSLDYFLNSVAQRTPTPGGGSVAAAAGALSCALARMAAEYSVGKNTEPGAKNRVQAIINKLRSTDELLRELVTQDAAAYSAMSTAGKNVRESAAAMTAYQKAVLAAVAVPLEAAAAVSLALLAMDELKDLANRHLLSDLGVAAVLADAAARAASYMVAVNLPELTDAELRTRLRGNIDQTVKHCEDHRRSVEEFVRARLESR